MASKQKTPGKPPPDSKDPLNAHFKSQLAFNKTASDHIAIFITNVFGSIPFLCGCLIFFVIWIMCNLGFFSIKPFDPYPFPALEMVVSLFAIILSVSVLINQTRQSRREKISQQIEFEVNVRAEKEITKMLEMLHDIQKKMGIDTSDSELEIMKQNINIQQLHQTLNAKDDLL